MTPTPAAAEGETLSAEELRALSEWSSDTPWSALGGERRDRWVRFAEKIQALIEKAVRAERERWGAERAALIARVQAVSSSVDHHVATAAAKAEQQLAAARAEGERLKALLRDVGRDTPMAYRDTAEPALVYGRRWFDRRDTALAAQPSPVQQEPGQDVGRP